MGIFSKVFNSSDLVSGMARRLGADIASDLLENPDTNATKMRSLVIRCAACRDQEGCAALQQGRAHLDHAPDYCMNKDYLEHLARG